MPDSNIKTEPIRPLHKRKTDADRPLEVGCHVEATTTWHGTLMGTIARSDHGFYHIRPKKHPRYSPGYNAVYRPVLIGPLSRNQLRPL